MVAALAQDLQACGHSIHLCFDDVVAEKSIRLGHSLGTVHPSKAVQFGISQTSIEEEWSEIARSADLTILIAPELDNSLQRWAEVLRSQANRLLISDDRFLRGSNDKWALSQTLRVGNIRHPETFQLSEFDRQNYESRTPNNGWVIKRRFGAGSVEMRCVPHAVDVEAFGSSVAATGSVLDDWIVQPWIEGAHVSVGLIAGEQMQVLPLMEQRFASMHDKNAGGYIGGRGPVKQVPESHVQRVAVDTIRCLEGQPLGWIGIDMIVEHDGELCVIEVNARMTSSFLGYRQLYGSQLANGLLGIGDFEASSCNESEIEFSVTDIFRT